MRKPQRPRSPIRRPRPARPTTPRPSQARPEAHDPAQRLQKALAQAGLGSRRQLEALIARGRILVNGRAAELGQRVGPGDRVVVDGRPVDLGAPAATGRLLLYHKPAGEIVSRSDPRGRPTVFERLPECRGGRWIAIGRLDFNTSGLLLFTDSGELAHRLMHPSFGLEREYAVRVLGQLSAQQKERLLEGVPLEDGPARFEQLEEAGGSGSNRWYRVVLMEGRNREVRRMFEAVGLTVSRLIRVGFGSVKLPRGLRQGHYRELSPMEAGRLLRPSG